jgi:hypothetical protein
MSVARRVAAVFVFVTACSGCPPKPGANSNPPKNSTPAYSNIQLESTLPQFKKHSNEVEIAASFNEIDPTNVLGSLVNLKTGEVRSLDNCLKTDAKPKVTPQAEIVFKKFIENSVAANVAWLDFVNAKLDNKVRAEVSVTKTARVTVDSSSLDRQKLAKVPDDAHDDYGVIIGYIDFVLSASLFTDRGAEGTASVYQAKADRVPTEDGSNYHYC